MKHKTLVFTILLLSITILLLSPATPALADAAPPEAPPGTNLLPGEEITQVRMVAETVTMRLAPDGYSAAVEAVFTMRNLGDQPEEMAARFPLSFWNGGSDGYFRCPEITDLRVFVNEEQVPTRRVTTQPREQCDNDPMPWAVFDVAFPPDEEVILKVTYTQNAYGYEPYYLLRYILETGAGWKDTIGSADIIVEMPYEVTPGNILLSGHTGYGGTTPGAVLDGRQVRWHFENLEPTSADNIGLLYVLPAAWEEVERAREQVERTPNDGEMWGFLGLAYKRVIRVRGWLRTDDGAFALYQQAVEAYDKAVTLDAGDADWHFGFAELLWLGYTTYGADMEGERPDFDAPATLRRALEELETTLQLKPGHEKARSLIDEIIWYSEAYGGAPFIQKNEDGTFTFLALTATPTPQPTVTPTATSAPATSPAAPTATVEPTATPVATPSPAETKMIATTPAAQTTPTPQSQRGGNPLPCLSGLGALAGFVLAPWAAATWPRRTKIH